MKYMKQLMFLLHTHGITQYVSILSTINIADTHVTAVRSSLDTPLID